MKQRTLPDLLDILDGAINDCRYTFNCHRVGIIQSFNAENQTATVQIVDKGVFSYEDGEKLIDFPPLVDCPVVISKGSKGGLTIPISEGDSCDIFFSDRDMDNWLIDGLIQRPNTLRNHHFSDAIIVIGIRNQVNKIADYNNDATELNYLDNKLTIDSTNNKFINSQGGSIVVNNKLELKNTAENLKAIVDSLLNIITNLKTVDPISGLLPIDPATSAALTALSTRVGNLLA